MIEHELIDVALHMAIIICVGLATRYLGNLIKSIVLSKNGKKLVDTTIKKDVDTSIKPTAVPMKFKTKKEAKEYLERSNLPEASFKQVEYKPVEREDYRSLIVELNGSEGNKNK